MSKFYVQGVYSIPGDNGEPVVNPYISDKVQRTATAIPIIYSFPGNSAASAPVSKFMCL